MQPRPQGAFGQYVKEKLQKLNLTNFNWESSSFFEKEIGRRTIHGRHASKSSG